MSFASIRAAVDTVALVNSRRDLWPLLDELTRTPPVDWEAVLDTLKRAAAVGVFVPFRDVSTYLPHMGYRAPDSPARDAAD